MFGAWKCYYKGKSGLQKPGLLKPTVFVMVSHVYHFGCTCVSCPWLLSAQCSSDPWIMLSVSLWISVFLFHQYVSGSDNSYFTEARCGSVSAKGFLPQAGTANKESLKNCPIFIRQFLFFHNNVKLPSAPALASWRSSLYHLKETSIPSQLGVCVSWASKFWGLLDPLGQGRKCMRLQLWWGSPALQLSIPCWGENLTTITPPILSPSSFFWVWAPTKWLQPVRKWFILPSPCHWSW